MNKVHINDPKMKFFLESILKYCAFMIFVLWAGSVIESFIPIDSRWAIIVLQSFFVIKITILLGLLPIPLLIFFKNPVIIRFGLIAVLAILIIILVVSGIATTIPRQGI